MRLKKSQPGSSDVHVPTAGYEEKDLDQAAYSAEASPVDNLEAQILKAVEMPEVYGNAQLGDNATFNDLYGMQQVIAGIDYELQNSTTDQDEAKELALANLSEDPNYYRVKEIEADNTSDDLALTKDTGENEANSVSDWPEGLNVDLGCGDAREKGHIGVDLAKRDHGTMVHDYTTGLPFPDSSVSKIRMVNGVNEGDSIDQKALLSEIQRVMMPGGQFYYEGPNEIGNYPEWMQEVSNESNADDVHKVEGNPIFRQRFMRIAQPDASTADDAEPRIGVAQYDMLPADTLLAIDALGYYWSDSTSSGRGNRIYGYPSQGALVSRREEEAANNVATKSDAKPGRRVATVAVRHGDHMLMGKRRDNGKWTVPGGHVEKDEDMHDGALRELEEEAGIKARNLKPLGEAHEKVDKDGNLLTVQPYQHMIGRGKPPKTSMLRDPDGEVQRWQWVNVKDGLPEVISENLHVPMSDNVLLQRLGLASVQKSDRMVPISKVDKKKQIINCVVLSPDELDSQDDWMTADDIEAAAHSYLENSRVIGQDHEKPIEACPVESYIAPVDFEWNDGPYGPQSVKKGSWIIGIKVYDPKIWAKVENGDYQGVSVGGFGVRD